MFVAALYMAFAGAQSAGYIREHPGVSNGVTKQGYKEIRFIFRNVTHRYSVGHFYELHKWLPPQNILGC